MKARDHYLWHEMHDVPSSAGMYAWYMSPRVAKADLKSANTAMLAVRQIAEKLRFPETSLSLDGHLSLALSGQLAHEHIGKVREFPSTFRQVVDTQTGRDFLGAVLSQVTPMFCSPLYIGVSSSLLRRLQQHRKIIEELSALREYVPSSAVDGEDALNRDYSFGQEVARRRIDPNALSVCVITVDHVVRTEGELFARQSVEGIETLLNRIFYPIFGRR